MALPRIQTRIVKNLHEYGRLSDKDMQSILNTSRDMSGKAMDDLLMEDYKITEFLILIAKAKAFGLNPFMGHHYTVTKHTFEELSHTFCIEHQVLPIGILGETVIVALTNPFDLQITNEIQNITGKKVSVLLGQEHEIKDILNTTEELQETESLHFGEVVSALHEEIDFGIDEIDENALDSEESGPIIQLANKIIEEAYSAGASDIHIEPFEKECRIRIRVDGICRKKATLPSKAAVILITRFKVMANLNIAEKRIPQDGRIVFQHFSKKGLNVDLRVSTAPLNYGEGIVMRILDKQKSTLTLKELGFDDDNLKVYKEVINKPYGMILHCGPTGSGKSMTLYSALNHINRPEIVIRTVEDPIEYVQEGLCQMQTHRKIGLTFSSALRSLLRQDPDVILVGEIRDEETANIAVEAALTGHLLFSTLHTNDASSAITRLLEMGIEPFMLSASLLCICAQRLMRRVCTSCSEPYKVEGREKDLLENALGWSGSILRANYSGCSSCGRTGYKGRIGMHEIMPISEKLIQGINQRSESPILKTIALLEGMKTLHQDSLRKVKERLSTFTEAITTVPPDREDLKALEEKIAAESHPETVEKENRRAQSQELVEEEEPRKAEEKPLKDHKKKKKRSDESRVKTSPKELIFLVES